MRMQVAMIILISLVFTISVLYLPHETPEPTPTATATYSSQESCSPSEEACKVASSLIPVQFIDNSILSTFSQNKLLIDNSPTDDQSYNTVKCTFDDPYGSQTTTLRPTDVPSTGMNVQLAVRSITLPTQQRVTGDPKSFTDYDSLFGKIDTRKVVDSASVYQAQAVGGATTGNDWTTSYTSTSTAPSATTAPTPSSTSSPGSTTPGPKITTDVTPTFSDPFEQTTLEPKVSPLWILILVGSVLCLLFCIPVVVRNHGPNKPVVAFMLCLLLGLIVISSYRIAKPPGAIDRPREQGTKQSETSIGELNVTPTEETSRPGPSVDVVSPSFRGSIPPEGDTSLRKLGSDTSTKALAFWVPTLVVACLCALVNAVISIKSLKSGFNTNILALIPLIAVITIASTQVARHHDKQTESDVTSGSLPPATVSTNVVKNDKTAWGWTTGLSAVTFVISIVSVVFKWKGNKGNALTTSLVSLPLLLLLSMSARELVRSEVDPTNPTKNTDSPHGMTSLTFSSTPPLPIDTGGKAVWAWTTGLSSVMMLATLIIAIVTKTRHTSVLSISMAIPLVVTLFMSVTQLEKRYPDATSSPSPSESLGLLAPDPGPANGTDRPIWWTIVALSITSLVASVGAAFASRQPKQQRLFMMTTMMLPPIGLLVAGSVALHNSVPPGTSAPPGATAPSSAAVNLRLRTWLPVTFGCILALVMCVVRFLVRKVEPGGVELNTIPFFFLSFLAIGIVGFLQAFDISTKPRSTLQPRETGAPVRSNGDIWSIIIITHMALAILGATRIQVHAGDNRYFKHVIDLIVLLAAYASSYAETVAWRQATGSKAAGAGIAAVIVLALWWLPRLPIFGQDGRQLQGTTFAEEVALQLTQEFPEKAKVQLTREKLYMPIIEKVVNKYASQFPIFVPDEMKKSSGFEKGSMKTNVYGRKQPIFEGKTGAYKDAFYELMVQTYHKKDGKEYYTQGDDHFLAYTIKHFGFDEAKKVMLSPGFQALSIKNRLGYAQSKMKFYQNILTEISEKLPKSKRLDADDIAGLTVPLMKHLTNWGILDGDKRYYSTESFIEKIQLSSGDVKSYEEVILPALKVALNPDFIYESFMKYDDSFEIKRLLDSYIRQETEKHGN